MEPTPQNRYKELIEKIQHRFTKMILYGGQIVRRQIKVVGLWTLEERRNRHDLIELFKSFLRVRLVFELMNCYENTKGTRGHCLKLAKIRNFCQIIQFKKWLASHHQ